MKLRLRTGPRSGHAPGSIVFLLAAVVVSLWVFVANGGLLAYFDSAYYITRGAQLVEMIGLADDLVPRVPAVESAARAQSSAGEPQSVDGSRAMVTSLVTGLFVWAGSVEGVALMNAAVTVGTLVFAFSVVLRALPVRPGAAQITFWAVLLASLGSLPFYVAFLMPDIYAPVLIVLAAALVAAAPQMRAVEIAAAVALCALAVTVHLSQLAIAIVLLPAVTLALLAIVGLGLAEQGLLRMAARETLNAEVVYQPLESAAAFLRNVLRQLTLNSVEMTLQSDAVVALVQGSPGFAFTGSGHGRLTAWTGWLPGVTAMQTVLYPLSAAVSVALLASRRLPRPVAVFVGFVLLGIVVNAVVCGGLSQPAVRCGACVAWLLPVAAVFGSSVLWTMRTAGRPGPVHAA